MGLTIHDKENCPLREELAELTGETPEAIIAALRERLEREGSSQEKLVRELLAIGRQGTQLLRGSDPTSTTVGNLLYDQDGLPKGGGKFALTDVTRA